MWEDQDIYYSNNQPGFCKVNVHAGPGVASMLFLYFHLCTFR